MSNAFNPTAESDFATSRSFNPAALASTPIQVNYRRLTSGPKPIERESASESDSNLVYRRFLKVATDLFGGIRVLTYIPTILTIVASANSNQHSLLTWLAWALANTTMAASIYEHNGKKMDNIVRINIGNTVMCYATIAVIGYYRLPGGILA